MLQISGPHTHWQLLNNYILSNGGQVQLKMNILAIEILLKVINNIYLFIPSNNNNRKNMEHFSKSNQIYTEVKIGKEK